MKNVESEVRVWVDFGVRVLSKHQKMSTVREQKKKNICSDNTSREWVQVLPKGQYLALIIISKVQTLF